MTRTLFRQFPGLIGLAMVAGSLSQGAFAETWAERLGFGADKKVVILHAHEMGMCQASNAAAQQLHESGLVFSSSAMAPCPWFNDFAKRATGDVGLTLTLNSEWSNYRWQPVSPDHQVPSLVDAEGYFWPTSVQTMVNGSAAEAEQELRNQVVRARLKGLQPTHFTTHIGTLFTRLDLAELYLRLAREYWIPAVVVELTPEHIEQFQQMGFPIPPELVQLIHDYPLPKVDELRFMPVADSYEAKKQAFLELMRGLPAGLTQVAFMPAVESEELKHVAEDWQQRVWEHRLLQDPEIRELLESEALVLTTWRELMQRYAGEVRREGADATAVPETATVPRGR